MKQKEKRITMTITLPPAVRKELQERAERTHRDQVALIEWGLEVLFSKVLDREEEAVKDALSRM